MTIHLNSTLPRKEGWGVNESLSEKKPSFELGFQACLSPKVIV